MSALRSLTANPIGRVTSPSSGWLRSNEIAPLMPGRPRSNHARIRADVRMTPRGSNRINSLSAWFLRSAARTGLIILFRALMCSRTPAALVLASRLSSPLEGPHTRCCGQAWCVGNRQAPRGFCSRWRGVGRNEAEPNDLSEERPACSWCYISKVMLRLIDTESGNSVTIRHSNRHSNLWATGCL
jgi:hypothetical protein